MLSPFRELSIVLTSPSNSKCFHDLEKCSIYRNPPCTYSSGCTDTSSPSTAKSAPCRRWAHGLPYACAACRRAPLTARWATMSGSPRGTRRTLVDVNFIFSLSFVRLHLCLCRRKLICLTPHFQNFE